MSIDKFQQQVQRTMDELRLQPTKQVWEQVERRIREKKKRRVIIIWFLFAGLLLAGGSLWLLNQAGTEKRMLSGNQKNEKSIKEINLPVNKNDITKSTDTIILKSGPVSIQQPAYENNPEINQVQTEHLRKPISNENNAKTKPIVNGMPVIARINKKKLVDTKPVIAPNNPPVLTKTGEEVVLNSNPTQPEAGNKPVSAQPVNTNPVQPSILSKADNVVAIQPTVTDLASESKLLVPFDSTANKDSVADLPVTVINTSTAKRATQKRKWQFGINTAWGNTRLTDGNFLDLNMKKSADQLSSPGAGGSNSTPPPVSYADSIPLSGPYWHIGVNAKRQLGKKTAFSAGLNFASFTTRQKVGVYIDSVFPINNDIRSVTFGGFYRPGQTKTFKNHYYFIQLPLLLHWQLNKGEKLPPITWENGFLPSFLIGCDALAYDKGSRTFYKDKRLYNDVQLGFHTGLSAGLFNKSKHPLSLGIFYNYNLSMLQKVSPPNYNYLNSFGARLNWVIKK